VEEQQSDAAAERLEKTLEALAGPLQQLADAADRRADSDARLAKAATRLSKAFGRFVNWITSGATMDEASAALSRGLHPEPRERG
jgi:hypothetical protein